ncbi:MULTISPECIES: hypothetical protein [unclassified Caballeronia]|uniref:hypothetical protein n=1 Tax=unclassified Caballeronia TaxID=2646786 RepID=UPI00285E0564|nr:MULTISPECIES: hypothetical protein [unclassified Caballeronia]MDR5752220.1 hypothetical protein [Caballeronia sp. LZ024]MDR5841931.1 hypothetical protein [Caballeronia sp. LZ031]
MSWSIPTFREVQQPAPISLRFWLPSLVAMALGIAGIVLLLWPHGKPAQGIRFWALLVGTPFSACALSFGARLDRWEHEQTIAEEMEREQGRIALLWRVWSRRHLCVTASCAVFPVSVSATQIGDAAPGMPLSSGRAKGFPWTNGKLEAWRRTKLLGVIAHGLRESLAVRQELPIKVLIDEASLENKDAWAAATKDAFSKVAPRCRFTVEVEDVTRCSQFLTQQVNLFSYPSQLVIAAQFWLDNDESPAFSEGAAALLFDADSSPRGSFFRPMTALRDKLETGLQQLSEMQVNPGTVSRVWLTGCDDASVDIRSPLTIDPKASIPERLLDNVLGTPGPASAWIALATALEASQGSGPQLVAWREPSSESVHLCLVAPAPAPQKETTV